MGSLDDVLDRAAFSRREVRLCLAGDLVEKYKQTRKDAESEDSLAAPSSARLAELETAIEEATVTLTVEAIPSAEWGQMVDAHPPKTDAQKQIGFDPAPFYRDAVKRCLVEVTDDQFDRLMEAVNDAQFDQLAAAILAVNRSAPDVDFTSRGSVKTGTSGRK